VFDVELQAYLASGVKAGAAAEEWWGLINANSMLKSDPLKAFWTSDQY
jgi:hypothetical protein